MFHCETPEDEPMILTWRWSMMEIQEIARIIPMNTCKQAVPCTFDWDTTNAIADGFTSSMIIFGYSEHDISASELELRITMSTLHMII